MCLNSGQPWIILDSVAILSDHSIGLIGILLLGILTMWYILYLKIVKVVGRRRRRREVVMEPSLSLSHLIHNCHAIVHMGMEESKTELNCES